MIPVDPTPGSDSWWTERLTWCEKLERVANDYEEPHWIAPDDWFFFKDWERSDDHGLAIYF